MPPKKSSRTNIRKKELTHDNVWKNKIPAVFFWPILLILVIFFIISVYNLLALLSVRQSLDIALQEIHTSSQQVKNYNNDKEDIELYQDDLYKELSEVDIVKAENNSYLEPNDNISPADNLTEVLIEGRVNSFGDGFSGLTYIDEEKTDMFWDERVTSFSFPPLYTLVKQSECSGNNCGLSMDSVNLEKSCLPAGCLSRGEDNNLFFQNKELLLPPSLNNSAITSINFFPLQNKWLIGLVTGPANAERAWVYYFDGTSFIPLITDKTDYEIKPLFSRGGGKVFFGGDDDDFLILYSAYESKAFRVRGGVLEDISDFFGFRVSSGGFDAQIFKVGTGAEAHFYICGLKKHYPLFLKIWPLDENSSGGAIDFASFAFKGDFASNQIICALNNADKREFAIASQVSNSQELWIFRDEGFDNSQSRKITSKNLNNSDQDVKAVVLSHLSFYSKNTPDDLGVNFFAANQENQFTLIYPYLWHSFSQEENSLYWQAEFKNSDNKFYSPWFYNLNRLGYLLSQ